MASFSGAIVVLLWLPFASSLQAALEADPGPRQVLVSRAAEARAAAQVAAERAAESESHIGVAGQGVEDTNCPQWCFLSRQYWHVKCTYSHCANCAMCGPYDHDRKEAALETEQQQLLGGRSAGSSAVTEVATERATESNSAVADQGSEGSAGSSAVVEVATERAAESNVAVADQGSEDPNCPQWCFLSRQYWHVKCTYSRCANCAMCGPYDHDRKEAALETEQQQLLGGRSAGSSAVAEVATERAAESNSAVADQGSEGSAGSSAVVEVATERAAESNVAVADQGSEDPNCPQWCFLSRQYWHVKCTYSRCANCAMCGPYDHDPKEAALETEQPQLLGGRSAGSSAVTEVATERATESNSAVAHQGLEGSAGFSAVVEVATERAAEFNVAVADQGSEDPNCPQWCFLSHEYWHVKCTYEGCAKCPMCGPYDHDPKEAALETEQQQLLGGRSAGSSAVAAVATEMAAESNVAVADQGSEDPNCPQWCFVSHEFWHVKCTYEGCANCAMCGPYDHDPKEAALETEQQQLLGGRSAGSSAVAEVATERATESNSAVADRGSEGSAGSSSVVEVATERATESNSAVADQGSEDPNCPQWCFVSHEFWHVKCTYEGCANCPMCGPYDHYPKEAALETEQQQLLGGRSAGSSAVAEVATERAADPNSAVADQGSEDSAGSSAAVEVATERAAELVADQDDPEGVMAALEQNGV